MVLLDLRETRLCTAGGSCMRLAVENTRPNLQPAAALNRPGGRRRAHRQRLPAHRRPAVASHRRCAAWLRLARPTPSRCNITDIVNAVCAIAAHTRVELACMDERHNLDLATPTGTDVSGQLKYFAERLPATFV